MTNNQNHARAPREHPLKMLLTRNNIGGRPVPIGEGRLNPGKTGCVLEWEREADRAKRGIF